jgi:hypothetical protein
VPSRYFLSTFIGRLKVHIIGGEAFHGDEKVMMAEAVEYAMDVQEFVPDEVIEAKEKCTICKKGFLVAIMNWYSLPQNNHGIFLKLI